MVAGPAAAGIALALLSACGYGATATQPSDGAPTVAHDRGPEAGPRSPATYRPQRLILTPTTDPATSQTVTWSHPSAKGVPIVTVKPAALPSTSPRTYRATRRPATSLEHSGTTLPRYTATLTDLTPDTTYEYWISDDGGSSAVARFTTATTDMPDGGWTFLAFGDTQIDNATAVRQIVTRATAEAPDADIAVQVGDVVNDPTVDAEWRDMFLAMGELAASRNWLVSIGNHEQCVLVRCESNDAEAFRSYFKWPGNGVPDQGPTWFSVDYQGVRFIVLDAFGGQLGEQAAFLEHQLRDNPHPWAVVVEHAPLYAPRPGRPNRQLRELWGPIIERHDVDLVLAGHDHSYARGSRRPDGPVYVVSVSGPKFYDASDKDWVGNGAQLEVAATRTATFQVIDVKPDRLEYRAVVASEHEDSSTSLEPGEVLDAFTIHKSAAGKRVTGTAEPDPREAA